MQINKINSCKNTFSSSVIFEKSGFTVSQSSQQVKNDEFVKKKSSPKLILGGIIAFGAVALGAYALSRGEKRIDCDYIVTLAQDMTKVLGEKVKPKQLDCVMGKQELLSILPKFSDASYKTFKIDLHSHTNFSDGRGSVLDILDEAAEQGNRLFKKTKEKFIFSITDHDGVEGTKEALKLIADNPGKYRNIRFVPGIELSFIHRCEPGSIQAGQNYGNKIEASELLVYCINPFSKNLNTYTNSLQASRANMISNTLDDLSKKIEGVKFLKEEVYDAYLKKPDENFAHSLHWRVNHYAQVKKKVTEVAQEQNQDPQELFKTLMSEWECDKNHKSLWAFNNFLAKKGMAGVAAQEDGEISVICRKYFPKIENGKIAAQQESTFEELIEMLSKEKDICAGFAHPVFLAKNFNDPEVALRGYVESSNGIIQVSEKYHQAYDMPQEEIDAVNNMIDKLKLLPVGGHDNHKIKLFN